MTTQISWMIDWMKCRQTEGQYTDVVVEAGWRCNGVNGQVSGTAYNTSVFPLPSGSFIPYPDLTQDQVLNWCWENGVDKTQIEALVEEQIQLKINPPLVELPLPWGQQP